MVIVAAGGQAAAQGSSAYQENAQTIAEELARPADWLARIPLKLDQGRRVEGATVPIAAFLDRQGNRYVAKHGSPRHLAAEMAAGEMRSLLGLPVVPVAYRKLPMPGVGVVPVIVKPFVTNEGRSLSNDPGRWNDLQREAILRELLPDHLLRNCDTHLGQYVLYRAKSGKATGFPVNIDFDNALSLRNWRPGQPERLSRFRFHAGVIPTSQNLLFDAFVHKRVDLDLGVLTREAARIGKIPRRRALEIFQRYARVAFSSPGERTQFVADAMRGWDSLGADARRLARDLQRERRSLPTRLRHLPRDILQRAATRAINGRLGTAVKGWLSRRGARQARARR